MEFHYWFEKSMSNVIHCVDRVIYRPDGKIEVRCCVDGKFKWITLTVGVSFSHFSVTLT